MVTITPPAATALSNLRTEKGAPDTYGVRFFATNGDASDTPRLAFNFVPSPEPEDTVIDDQGLKAFVAPEVEQVMSEIIVDVDNAGPEESLVVKRPSEEA
jgi:Fe-S cluster assembly iron-binding protein IscA